VGIFSRIGKRANAALDKAIDPAKEIEMAILELEEGRRVALQELISYKATAKQMEQEIEKYTERAAMWEKKAMLAVRAGDDEAAKAALRERKHCLTEIIKITRDRDEAASYAIQLNKSRKEFEVKLQMLRLRKGTLATQLAAARSGGDAFGNDSEVWDKFERAEQRIDAEAIETEVDAAMRGDEAAEHELEARILAAGASAQVGPGGADPDDQLARLKAKMIEDKAKKEEAKRLAAGKPEGKGDE
jgi:phage shock protein A